MGIFEREMEPVQVDGAMQERNQQAPRRDKEASVAMCRKPE